MVTSLRVALEGIIDYAGLFPPAALELSPAVHEFTAHLAGPEAFLVNRFVCPCARLASLADLLASSASVPSFGVTAIGSTPVSAEGFADAVATDAQAIADFDRRMGGIVGVEAYETKLQPSALGDQFRALRPLHELDIYLEWPWNDELTDTLHALSETQYMAKGRTGGVQPGSHPSAEKLADFLAECLELDLPFKLTAGLHHPFPTADRVTGDTMHGFLNVLCALALAEDNEMSRPEMANVLRSPREAVLFSPEGLEWGDFFAEADTLEAMRSLFQGFGSCSVDEPLADLNRFGLWG